MSVINTTCCIVGGGPAGMMAGFLLARAGINTTVIEKHADFFRDFRGDTVHPSTLELMQELGILNDFLNIQHQEVKHVGVQVDDQLFMLADFSRLKTKCKFLALMPQWDFLNFISSQALRYKSFSLHMNTEASGLIKENGRIVGVKAKTSDNEIEIRSKLVIGADGRDSIIRRAAGYKIKDIGAPMDVLWFQLSKHKTDPPQTLGRIKGGMMMIMLNREDYWQCGFVIRKGEFERLRSEGYDAFRNHIVDIAPFLADRVYELTSWDDIKLLTVKIDRLDQWHQDGLLCIGDSAHAMSPIGGVGINLAIQDAVATANFLWKPLLENHCTNADLEKVQQQRSFPTIMTQNIQVFLQNNVVNRALSSQKTKFSTILKLFKALPILQELPGYLIGMGFRPEHINSPRID